MLTVLRLLLLLLTLGACATSGRPVPFAEDPVDPPPVAREFRGVWVASVSNIDWPSRPGLPAAEQQAELLRILDRARELRLNAVILQVRPAGDALYASELEPWSEYLTGEMGKAPDPLYDPLEFAVTEAHRRGLELHAWFNPYRARHPSATSSIDQRHISRARPELVRVYGRHLWMDPGEPAVREHTVGVILDVVRRYDVDGVHIDDYFYPYKERDSSGELIDFPDSLSYERYRAGGGGLARNDWRRRNVDQLVEELYQAIGREKPWVRFGVSPIGMWRPRNPPQIGGFDAYDQIYADARKWFANGWLDYFTPQLYWPIGRTDASFPVLLGWWADQNGEGRHLWPGLIPNNVGEPGSGRWPASEIMGQIYVTRGHPGSTGHVHFSMRTLLQDPDSLSTRLSRETYAEPALVPASPWLRPVPPARPRADLRPDDRGGAELRLTPARAGEVWLWTVRARVRGAWTTAILPGWTRSHTLPERPAEVRVTAVARTGAESGTVVARPDSRSGNDNSNPSIP